MWHLLVTLTSHYHHRRARLCKIVQPLALKMAGQLGRQLDESAIALKSVDATLRLDVDLASLIDAYRLAAESSPDLIFIFKPDGAFAYVNPKAITALGYDESDLIDKPLERIGVSSPLWPLPDDDTAPSRHPTEPPRVELRRKGGTTLWLELTLSPITVENSVLGWLGIGRDISSQRRAEQWLLRAHRQVSAVQVVMAEATQAVDLQATLDTTLERVIEVLDAEVGVIFLLSPRSNRLAIVSHRGISRAAISQFWGPGLRLGEGLAGRVVSSGEPLLLANVAHQPVAARRAEHLRVVACVPLRAEGKIVGAIGLGRREAEEFSADEVAMLASIGSQVGVVIENARLRAELSLRAGRLAALYHAGRAIAAASTPATVFSTSARAATQLTGSAAAVVLLLDEATQVFRPVAAQNVPASRWRGAQLPATDRPLGDMLAQGQPALFNRVQAQALEATQGVSSEELGVAFPAFAEGLIDHVSALVAVPLRARNRVIGALLAVDRKAGAYDEQALELLSCLADQVAAAIEHVRLHQELTEQAEQASALSEITKAVVANLELEHVVKSLAGHVRKLIAYDRLLLAVANESDSSMDVFMARADAKIKSGKRTRVMMSDIALGRVLHSGEPLLRRDLGRENNFAWDGILLAAGMRSDVAVPLIARGKPIGALSLVAAGEDAFGEPEIELLRRIADKVSMAVENAKLHQQTIADVRELKALREVVESFSAELDLDRLLHKIVVAATDLVGGGNGSIALVDETENAVRMRALHNLPASLVGTEIVRGQGPLGQVLASGQPVLMHRYGEQGRADASYSASDYLAVPIWWQDRLIGTFAVGSNQRPARFSIRDTDMLQILAKHAAIAIENARLYRQGRDLAVTEERNRLARDIHDTLAQSLTGIVLQLETVATLLPQRPEEAAQELQEARSLARRSLDEARQSVWGLHPTPLRSTTLDQAIEREIRSLAKQAGVVSHFTVRGDVQQLQPDIATALFRIAQEALSNIRKHAEAKSIRGVLQFGDDAVSLTIEDDGVGIHATPDMSPRGGFGLTSMGERARLLGGELRVDSSPGRGTRLSVSIPYQMPSHQDSAPSADLSRPAQTQENAIRVMVADDHPIARQGIRRMLETCADIVVVGEATDGEEAVALSKDLRPDVILMDLQMPRMNGVEAIQQLRATNPEVRVLIISTYSKDEFLFEGIKAGARGYLLKDVPAEELVQAVRAVSRGESLLRGVVAGKLLDRLGQLARGEVDDQLTEREAEVLRLLASGARNKEIARSLFITEKTVKFHVANIFRKLNAGSRTEAMAIAIERGLLDQSRQT